MPLYDYLCRQCGATFEKLRRMQDADEDLTCPRCESSNVERMLSTFSSGGCGSGSTTGRFR